MFICCDNVVASILLQHIHEALARDIAAISLQVLKNSSH